MTDKTKKWLKFALRWTIAAAGIAFVLWKIDFHDGVTILYEGRPLSVRVAGNPKEDNAEFSILPPGSEYEGKPDFPRTVKREQLWVDPDLAKARLKSEPGTKFRILAAQPGEPAPRPGAASKGRRLARQLLVEHPDTGVTRFVGPAEIADRDADARFVSSPLLDVGLIRLVREADLKYLLAALAVLPLSYFLTSYRWKLLLEALDIRLGTGRVFVLNMVGAFYNSFMPGSTGGDVLKAYYISKHTDHRTRGVLSVLVDRLIGLLALIILGGAMAAAQFHVRECARIAVASGVLLLAFATGLLVFYNTRLRRLTGLDFILKRLPLQRQVHKAVEALHIYGRRPMIPLAALLLSFPVHITTIVSATLAGRAFDLPLGALYYWVVVPVTTLAGAIPISPQGAGVMEFMAITLTEPQGATPGQAVALAMSIRLGQIFWNLIAGIFVLRGGYHAPTEKEQHELEDQIEHEHDPALEGSNGEWGPSDPAPGASSQVTNSPLPQSVRAAGPGEA